MRRAPLPRCTPPPRPTLRASAPPVCPPPPRARRRHRRSPSPAPARAPSSAGSVTGSAPSGGAVAGSSASSGAVAKISASGGGGGRRCRRNQRERRRSWAARRTRPETSATARLGRRPRQPRDSAGPGGVEASGSGGLRPRLPPQRAHGEAVHTVQCPSSSSLVDDRIPQGAGNRGCCYAGIEQSICAQIR